jgi:branched-chain amino acid transport system permease protein
MSKRSDPLRDAALSALVALGLFAPIVGLRTLPGTNGLTLLARPLAVAVLVAAVFVGRLLMLRWQARRPTPRPAARAPSRLNRLLAPGLLVVAVLLPWIAGRATIDLGVLVLTYVMLGWGLNIVVGLAGLLDLGYVAFYAVGAYAYALLSTTYGLGFWTCLPLAGLMAAAFGVALGAPVLRLRGDYLAIVTLAFGEIIRVVLINWTSLTNGANGIGGIPRPTLFGLRFTLSNGPGTFAGALGIAASPARGRHCARTRSPPARWASTSPSPS